MIIEDGKFYFIKDEFFDVFKDYGLMVNKAQEILAQRSNEFKLNNKREKTEYVFSTLIYCKHCGCNLMNI